MVPIAQEDQCDGQHMMRHQLLEILPRLLLPQQHHHRLLNPIRRLEQVVKFEHRVVRHMGVPLVHAACVEVPEPRRLMHRVQAERPGKRKIARRVHLLHEPGLLGSRMDPAETGEGPEDFLHDEFAGEGEEDGVEPNEGEVQAAFSILVGVAVGLVREEKERPDYIALRWVDGVERYKAEHKSEREHPGSLKQSGRRGAAGLPPASRYLSSPCRAARSHIIDRC